MKKIILYTIAILFIFSFMFSSITYRSSLNALTLWLHTLVPSFLFPFIIIRLLSPYHLLRPLLKIIEPIILFIFKINAEAMECILTSFFLGFPSSSIYLEEIAKKNNINKKQYERLLYSVYLASPNFILISLNTIYSTSITRTILYIQLISIFLLLLCTRNTPLLFKQSNQSINFFKQLSQSITKSFEILFIILAYLLLIYVIIDISTLFLSDIIKTPLKLLGEFSSGCFFLSKLDIPLFYKILFTNILLSYGGLCVHMQIINSVNQINFNYYTFIKYRLFHIVFAIILSYIFSIWIL